MVLKVDHLRQSYGTRQVLHDVSFSIGEDQIVGLLGCNGSGKSTLIKCVNDLLVYSGKIDVCHHGQSIDARKDISYLPEQSSLNPRWKVRQAVRFFKDFYEDFDEKKALDLIEVMRLPIDAEIKTMSKGMQEKLQLILVMSRQARLYILDEPLGGVDPASRDKILDTILTNFCEGASLLISTHLIADVERILDRVLILRDGRIVEDAWAEAIREKSGQSVDAYFRTQGGGL